MRTGNQIIILEISGDGTEALDVEKGGHRIQRVASTDKRGRVHSSTVTVAVLGGEVRSSHSPYLQRKDSDFQIAWFSGTGCGGQHRNKHMNSARVTHIPTGIVKTAQTRSRENSLMSAMAALHAELDQMSEGSLRSEENRLRQKQVGTGQRSDRRRMWAFQRDCVEDFQTGKTMRCSDAMKGHIDRLW